MFVIITNLGTRSNGLYKIELNYDRYRNIMITIVVRPEATAGDGERGATSAGAALLSVAVGAADVCRACYRQVGEQ